jgi:hypothetical protein
MTLYDGMGQLVHASQVEQQVTHIDMQAYAPGMYVLKVGKFTKKIVKE